MKRRYFILSASALATISLTLSGTMASFANSASALANFQTVVPMDTETRLELIPDSAGQESTHVWEFGYLFIDDDVDTITVDYPAGTSLDGLTEKDVIVELDRSGDGDLKEIKVNKVDSSYSGSTDTFDLAGNFNTNIEGLAKVTIEGVTNPGSGVYEPEMTFDTGTDSRTLSAEMGVTGDAAFYEPAIDSAPSEVTVGDDLVADYTITNTGTGPGNQEITITAGSGEESTTKALDAGDSYSDTFSYTTSTDDAPSVDLVVATEDTSVSREIIVGGEWDLDLDPAKQNTSSIHTWSTGFIDYQGEVDTITVDYPGGNQGASLDGLTEQDVTVEITRQGEDQPTTIDVNTGNYSGSTATFDLDGRYDTDIDGPVIVTIDGVENPKKGDYTADITLDGTEETATYTVSFTI
ncbi:hypothetical protein [Halohasta salina]|uniref:hypothetical protein n=1 Tax=Halohasta salina TaxID=2961621 RepID=UPI0020A2953B|nr:hypothetical protein [Halohasta salina]